MSLRLDHGALSLPTGDGSLGHPHEINCRRLRGQPASRRRSRLVPQWRHLCSTGPASILSEPIPAGVLNVDGVLQLPPAPVPAIEILPAALPAAWSGEVTTATAILTALSQKAGINLPWITVRTAIDGALSARFLELADDSGPWPCELSGANSVRLKVPVKGVKPPPPPPPPPGSLVAEAYLDPGEIQNLGDSMGELTKAVAGQHMKYKLRIEFGGTKRPLDTQIKKVEEILKRVSDKLELK